MSGQKKGCVIGFTVDNKQLKRKDSFDLMTDAMEDLLIDLPDFAPLQVDNRVATFLYNKQEGNTDYFDHDKERLAEVGIKLTPTGKIKIPPKGDVVRGIVRHYKSLGAEGIRMANAVYNSTASLVADIGSLEDRIVELKEQHEKRWDNIDTVNEKSAIRADEVVRNTLNNGDDSAYYFSIKRGPLENAIKYLSKSEYHLIPSVSDKADYVDYVAARASVLIALRNGHTIVTIGNTKYDIGETFIRAKTVGGNKNMGLGVMLTSNDTGTEKELVLGTIPTHKKGKPGYSEDVNLLYTSILPEGKGTMETITIDPSLLNSMTSGAVNRMTLNEKEKHNEDWTAAKARLIASHPSTTFSNLLIRTDKSEHGGDAYVIYSTTGAALTGMTQSDLMATLDKHISNKLANPDTMVSSDFGFIKLDRKPLKAKNMIDLIFKGGASLNIESKDIPKLRRYIRTDGRERQYAAVVHGLYEAAVKYNNLPTTKKSDRIDLNGVDKGILDMNNWLDKNPEFKINKDYDHTKFSGDTGQPIRDVIESLAKGDGTYAVLKYTADGSPMIDILHTITRMVTTDTGGLLTLNSDEEVTKVTKALDYILSNHKGFENGFHFNFGIDHKGSRDAMAFLESSPDGMNVEEFAGHTLQGTVSSISPNGLLLDVGMLTDAINNPETTLEPETIIQPAPVVAPTIVTEVPEADMKTIEGILKKGKLSPKDIKKLKKLASPEQLTNIKRDFYSQKAVKFVKEEFMNMVIDPTHESPSVSVLSNLDTATRKVFEESLAGVRATADALNKAIKEGDRAGIAIIMESNPEYIKEAEYGALETLSDEVGDLASSLMDQIHETKGLDPERAAELTKELEFVKSLYVDPDKIVKLQGDIDLLTDNMIIQETDEANSILEELGQGTIESMSDLDSALSKIYQDQTKRIIRGEPGPTIVEEDLVKKLVEISEKNCK